MKEESNSEVSLMINPSMELSFLFFIFVLANRSSTIYSRWENAKEKNNASKREKEHRDMDM